MSYCPLCNETEVLVTEKCLHHETYGWYVDLQMVCIECYPDNSTLQDFLIFFCPLECRIMILVMLYNVLQLQYSKYFPLTLLISFLSITANVFFPSWHMSISFLLNVLGPIVWPLKKDLSVADGPFCNIWYKD